MIDMHSHAIYDIDDGSKNVEQTIRMLKQAQETGFDAICFTPHYMDDDGYKPTKTVINLKLERIKELAKVENINLNFYLGEEVFIFPKLLDKIKDFYTLNDSKYLMIELPLLEDVNYLDDIIDGLLDKGIVPVLAHPERYFVVSSDFKYIESLCEKGVLLQVNLNSLVGHYGKEAQRLAVKLLKRNMVAFVASDAHSSSGYHKCKESLAVLKDLVGEDKFMELTSINPNKVLLNIDIKPWGGKMEIIKSSRFFIKSLLRK